MVSVLVYNRKCVGNSGTNRTRTISGFGSRPKIRVISPVARSVMPLVGCRMTFVLFVAMRRKDHRRRLVSVEVGSLGSWKLVKARG